MKLPSIQLLTQAFIKVLKRFPFVLLAALMGTVVSIALAEGNYEELKEITLIKLAMASSLGLPLFFAIHMFCEKWNAKPMFKFIALLTGLFLLVQFYYSMAPWMVHNGNVLYRFFFWSAGMHLIVAFSVFFVAEELNGFWQFNKQLFLRFLTAALYSGVLYLGLAGAILAVEELFNLNIDHDIYIDLWNVIAGLFNTVFFLGGIEEPVEDLNNQHSYPKGLKIFTQYVLLPLVTVYLVILYAYMAKIIALRSLPQGWVTNLILGFSVTGILSLLLVWPLREQEENKWIKTFTRFFYFSLVPLITLLFVAIGTRINAYGVTIERYIVAMLGIWLALITLYFIFSKRKTIILIPLTLALFLFGSCFGPWGMFAVSERSQVRRLKILLEKNHILVNGKLVTPSNDDLYKIKEKDGEQITSIMDYLAHQSGLQVIADWMDTDCRKKVLSDKFVSAPYDQVLTLQKCIGLFGFSGFENAEVVHEVSMNFYSPQMDNSRSVDVSNYSTIYKFEDEYTYNEDKVAPLSEATLKDNEMTFQVLGQVIVRVNLNTLVSYLISSNFNRAEEINVSPYRMTIETTDLEGKKIKVMFEKLDCTTVDSVVTVKYIRGYILR